MTDTQIDLAAYQGKRVKLKLNRKDREELEELEGVVELVGGPAMIIKPRGSTMNRLIESDSIVAGSLELVPETPRELKPKRHQGLSLSNARHHLLDRHGYELAVINRMSDEQAYREHELIDHDRLGHFHEERPTEAASEE